MVFVAVDDAGTSVPVPQWQPVDTTDEQQQADVVRRIKVRAEIEDAMATQSYTDEGTAPQVCLRFLAAPTDVNWGGKVHGGKVMRWIDEAAHVLATQWLGTDSNIAVYAGGVRFYRPLRIGHLVEVEARLLHTGDSSSTSACTCAPATRPSATGLTTHCLIVFVRLDAERPAGPARQWEPVSAEDVALDEHAGTSSPCAPPQPPPDPAQPPTPGSRSRTTSRARATGCTCARARELVCERPNSALVGPMANDPSRLD